MKLVVLFVAGFDDDEAYTIVIARKLALSYFDHPPLHQWIVHGFSRVFGEGHALRLPFWALIVATNLPLYGLTRRLFGGEAALWTLFAFNASAYFLVLPDGFILPDAPLLPLIAAAVWAIVEATFPSSPAPRSLPLRSRALDAASSPCGSPPGWRWGSPGLPNTRPRLFRSAFAASSSAAQNIACGSSGPSPTSPRRWRWSFSRRR